MRHSYAIDVKSVERFYRNSYAQQQQCRDAAYELIRLGISKSFLPEEFGGADCSLLDVSVLLQRLSRLDVSLGWLAMTFVLSPILVAQFGRDFFRQIYRSTPELVLSSSTYGQSKLSQDSAGHLTLDGEWSFVSGLDYATHVLVEAPHVTPAGTEPSRVLILTEKKWGHLSKNSGMLGLSETSTDNFALRNYSLASGTYRRIERPEVFITNAAYNIPIRVLCAILMASVAMGGARAAIDCAVSREEISANSKRSSEENNLEWILGDLDIRQRAGNALLENSIESACAIAGSGESWPAANTIELRAASVFCAEMAVDAARQIFAYSGSRSIFAESKIQRILRDCLVVKQHANLSTASITQHGRYIMSGSV